MRLSLLRFSALSWVAAACASSQPRWISVTPQGYQNDYFVGEGTAESQEAAKRAAVATALTRIAESNTVSLQARSSVRTATSFTDTESRSTSVSATTDVVREIVTAGQASLLNGIRVREEHTEIAGSQRNVWVLMSAPKAEPVRAVPTRATAVLRSTVLPGWGQYTLGYERTGFLLGSVVLSAIPTGVALLGAQDQNRRLAEATLIQSARRDYVNKANALGVLSNVTLATAAATWAFAVFNASSAPFKLYVDGGALAPSIGIRVPLPLRVASPVPHTAVDEQ